jgi:hypothetical protein
MPSPFIYLMLSGVGPMANEWHYTINGQPAATPVNSAQLKQLAASGQLKPTDLVWQDGMLEWAPAGSVRGLFTTNKSLGDSAVVPPVASTTKVVEKRKTAAPQPPLDWATIHPLLVFVLTLLTCGIFGLIYAYEICQAYARKGAGRKIDAAGRALGQVRHPLAVLLLSYLTLGFYFYYWAYRAMGECREFLGRKDALPRSELSLMLIFPPYAIFVAMFLLPELIRRAQTLANVPETPALRYAVLFVNPWLVLALPFLAMISQESLNQLWLTSP